MATIEAAETDRERDRTRSELVREFLTFLPAESVLHEV